MLTVAALGATLAGCGTNFASSTKATGSEVSPLSDYLALGHHVLESEMQFNTDVEQRESLISACMAKSGFEYWPVPPDVAYAGDRLGNVTKLGDHKNASSAHEANARYVSQLSPAEQGRYWRALADRDDGGEGISEAEMKRRDLDGDGQISYAERLTQGCRGAADREVPGVYYVTRALGDDFDALQKQISTTRSKALGVLTQCLSPLAPDLTTNDSEYFARALSKEASDLRK